MAASRRVGDWIVVVRGIALAYCLGEGTFYLWWLTEMSWRAAQGLPAGDSMRWGFPVFLIGSAMTLVPLSGFFWWHHTASGGTHYMRAVRPWLPLIFVGAYSVVAAVVASSAVFSAILASATMTFLGFTALFFLPVALSPRLRDVLGQRQETAAT